MRRTETARLRKEAMMRAPAPRCLLDVDLADHERFLMQARIEQVRRALTGIVGAAAQGLAIDGHGLACERMVARDPFTDLGVGVEHIEPL